MRGQGEEAAEKLEKLLGVTGLDRATTLGYALGFRDGGMEGVCHLAMPEGAGGLLEALRNGLQPVGDLGEALALIPAAAHEVQASRFAAGKLLADADRVVRATFPESGDVLDQLYGQVEENARISIKDDLFTLGDLMLCTFSVDPPAAGTYLHGTIVNPSRIECGIEAYYVQEGEGRRLEQLGRNLIHSNPPFVRAQESLERFFKGDRRILPDRRFDRPRQRTIGVHNV